MIFDADNSDYEPTVPDGTDGTTAEYVICDTTGDGWQDEDELRSRLPDFYYAHRPLVWMVFKCCDYYGFYYIVVYIVVYIVFHAWLAKHNTISFFMICGEGRWFSGIPP